MNPTLRRRLTFWALPVLGLLVALLWLFRTPPVPVDLVAATRGPLQVSVSDEGETRVRDVFVVSAPIAGQMQRIDLEVGDPVEAQKTVIARIEPADPAFLDPRTRAEARAARDAAAAARSFAEAQVRRAAAEREFADAEYQRIKTLAEQKTVSRNDLDAAERRAKTAAAALEEAGAALKVREFEYAQANARLLAPGSATRPRNDPECITVYSPVSGTVLRIVRESAGVVQSGAALVEIGDPGNLEIVVDLLSEDAVRVRPGQRALIEAWGGERPLQAVIRRVEPFGFMKVSALGIEEQRVNVILDFTEPRERWSRLGHGYRVEPRVILWESDDVLRVPLSALFRQGEGWAVFVADRSRAALRPVKVGRQNGIDAQIVSGLEPGDEVVLHPSDRVSDGARIARR